MNNYLLMFEEMTIKIETLEYKSFKSLVDNCLDKKYIIHNDDYSTIRMPNDYFACVQNKNYELTLEIYSNKDEFFYTTSFKAIRSSLIDYNMRINLTDYNIDKKLDAGFYTLDNVKLISYAQGTNILSTSAFKSIYSDIKENCLLLVLSNRLNDTISIIASPEKLDYYRRRINQIFYIDYLENRARESESESESESEEEVANES